MRYLNSPSTLRAPPWPAWPARTDARAVLEVLLATEVLLARRTGGRERPGAVRTTPGEEASPQSPAAATPRGGARRHRPPSARWCEVVRGGTDRRVNCTRSRSPV